MPGQVTNEKEAVRGVSAVSPTAPDTVAYTGSDTASTTWAVGPCKPAALPSARSSISCEVTAQGELVLRPLDALGAYFLHHFGHGEIRSSWSYIEGCGDEGRGAVP